MSKLRRSENSHLPDHSVPARMTLSGWVRAGGASKTIILSSLILIFLAMVMFVVNKNIFIFNLDNTIKAFVENHQSAPISSFMLSITNIGDMYGIIIIFLVFGLFLVLKNRKAFYTFTFAITSGIILTEIIKHLTQRARPYNLMEQGFGFPSAHATMATIFLLSSFFLLIPIMEKRFSKNTFLVIASVVFPLVAFSRIYLSVHWASDVIAGIILGSICFLLSKMVCCYKKENML